MVDPVSAEAEAVVVLAEEDLLLAELEVETAKCFQQSAVTAEKSARFLLDPQTASRFIAAIVLKKWVTEATDPRMTDPGLMTEHPVLPKHKVDPIWEQLMPNWIRY